MADTVFDASFVAVSRGNLSGRRPGNVLDRRLRKIEEFLRGARIAWYNDRLLTEYVEHLKGDRNDVIQAFLIRLADVGKRTRSTLSRPNYVKARTARWPTHDHHVIAAAIEADNCTIFVTETALENCAAAIKRTFSIIVVRIA